MKGTKRSRTILLSLLIMLVLILEGKAVAVGVTEGITLCVKSVIPSLFPFFVLTSYMNPYLIGAQFPGVTHLGKFLKLPIGQESLLLLGLIGGYPVGAQLIADNYRRGSLERRNAAILMGFCNNAGPAFIFGITGSLFQQPVVPWILWIIHLISAILTALLLPRCTRQQSTVPDSVQLTLPQALQKGLIICSSVCGWILLFKAILTVFKKWFATLLGEYMYICFSGMLELSNGCLQLSNVMSPSLRFILCAAFLSFGGLCIAMQTLSVAASLGFGLYLPGKVIQTLISIAFALPVAAVLFDTGLRTIASWLAYSLIASVVIFLLRLYCRKKLWKLCSV